MTIRYGRNHCAHQWRYRIDGWEEGCIPAICKECGAFGCSHDHNVSKELFFKEGYSSYANPNGKWMNPYLKKKDEKSESSKTLDNLVKN